MARSACAAMPTLRRAAPVASSRCSCGRAAPEARTAGRACDSSAICTFSTHRHRAEGLGDLEGAARRPGARSRAACRPTSSRPSSRIEPASGASWPLTMLKQVVLPAPFGPISASSSPAAELEADVVDRLHAAEGLGQVAHLRAARHACILLLALATGCFSEARQCPAGTAAPAARMIAPSSARQ